LAYCIALLSPSLLSALLPYSDASRAALSSFFFHAPATPAIHTLSLHDALPISEAGSGSSGSGRRPGDFRKIRFGCQPGRHPLFRSEEHSSELQSRFDLVCRLLLEKKKTM